jgi:hypothetical protein
MAPSEQPARAACRAFLVLALLGGPGCGRDDDAIVTVPARSRTPGHPSGLRPGR